MMKAAKSKCGTGKSCGSAPTAKAKSEKKPAAKKVGRCAPRKRCGS